MHVKEAVVKDLELCIGGDYERPGRKEGKPALYIAALT